MQRNYKAIFANFQMTVVVDVVNMAIAIAIASVLKQIRKCSCIPFV